MGFFKHISSASGLIVQLIVVIAAVVAFSYFDPFGLLSSGKRTLKNTPIQVQSIKEIGQLITAEYYGEVLGSLNEVLTQKTISEIDSFNYRIDALHSDFLAAMDSIARLDLKRKEIYPRFKADYDSVFSDSLFGFYAYYINEKLKNRNYSKRETNKKLDDNGCESLITNLGWKRKNQLRESLHDISTGAIQANFKYNKEKDLTKNRRNHRLVILGRGWVKAGFDFGSFTDKNFIYDSQHHRAIFIGLQPKILSASINPWFIPEEGVEGFEFVIAERKVKNDPEWTKKVKQLCLDKLVVQATRKNILDQAQTNAERHLRNLFSLLSENQITDIRVYTDYLDYSLGALMNDSILRDEEIPLVKSLIEEYRNRTGTDFKPGYCTGFIDSLERSPKKIKGLHFSLNSKSSLLFRILQDQKVDSADMQWLKQAQTVTAYDSIWFECLKTSRDSSFPRFMEQVTQQFQADLVRMATRLSLPDSAFISHLNETKRTGQ